jgi:FlaG/FlaF family flagellin (archaellin)
MNTEAPSIKTVVGMIVVTVILAGALSFFLIGHFAPPTYLIYG